MMQIILMKLFQNGVVSVVVADVNVVVTFVAVVAVVDSVVANLDVTHKVIAD